MSYHKLFNLLKTTLLESGYEVQLVRSVRTRKPYVLARPAKGYLAPDDLKIVIDKSLGLNDRVITLIHELLHETFPAWLEERVERSAVRLFHHLTISQLGFLQFFVLSKGDTFNFLKAHRAAV